MTWTIHLATETQPEYHESSVGRVVRRAPAVWEAWVFDLCDTVMIGKYYSAHGAKIGVMAAHRKTILKGVKK
jgi:phage gp37-like protein